MMWHRIFFATEIAGGATRRGVFWRGLLLVLVGMLIAFQPLLATFTMSLIFGWGLLFSGVWTVVSAFRLPKRRWAWGLYGILLTAAGLLLLVNPEAELLAFAWSVAAVLLSGGMIGVSVGLAAHNSSMWNMFCFISSLLSILLGLLLLMCPVSGMADMFWLLGLLLAADGISLLIFAFRIPAGVKEVREEENTDKP